MKVPFGFIYPYTFAPEPLWLVFVICFAKFQSSVSLLASGKRSPSAVEIFYKLWLVILSHLRSLDWQRCHWLLFCSSSTQLSVFFYVFLSSVAVVFFRHPVLCLCPLVYFFFSSSEPSTLISIYSWHQSDPFAASSLCWIGWGQRGRSDWLLSALVKKWIWQKEPKRGQRESSCYFSLSSNRNNMIIWNETRNWRLTDQLDLGETSSTPSFLVSSLKGNGTSSGFPLWMMNTYTCLFEEFCTWTTYVPAGCWLWTLQCVRMHLFGA